MASGTKTFEFYRTSRYTTQEQGDTVDTKHDSEITFPSNTKVTKVDVYVDQGLHSGSGTGRDVDVGIDIDCDGWISIYDESLFLSGAGGDGTRDFGTIIIDKADKQRTIANNGIQGIRFVQTGGYSVEGKSDLTGTATFYYEDAASVTINTFSISQNNNGQAVFSCKATGSNGSGSVSYKVEQGSTQVLSFSGSSGSTITKKLAINTIGYGSSKSFKLTATYSGSSATKTTSKIFYKPTISNPSSLTVTPTSGASATLSWSGSSLSYTDGTVKYRIYKNGSQIGTASTTSYSLNESVVSEWGTDPVTLEVSALGTELTNSDNGTSLNSNKTNAVTFTYVQPYTDIGAPTNLTINKNYINIGEQLVLNWSAAQPGTNNNVVKYEIYKNGTKYGEVNSSVLTYTINTNLVDFSEGTSVSFYVIAIGEKNTSLASNSEIVYFCSAPQAPTFLEISKDVVNSKEEFTVSWQMADEGAYNPIIGYQILISNSQDSGYYEAGNITTNQKYGQFTFTNLELGKTYYVRIRTLGQYSNSETSTEFITFSTSLNYSNCQAPTVFSISKQITNKTPATLFWSGASMGENNPIAGYTIEKVKSADGVTHLDNWTVVESVDSTTSSLEVSPPKEEGYYYIFRIKTNGIVEGYDSSWLENGLTLQNYDTTSIGFTDETFISGVTRVRAIHMIELQNITNTLRSMYDLEPYSFSEIISGITEIKYWTQHVNELRSAIEPMYSNSITWIEIQKNKPSITVMEELRNSLRNLDIQKTLNLL